MGKFILILIFLALTGFFAYQFLFQEESVVPPTDKIQPPEILVEEIPGSKFHSPDGTWWGYNQSKIVRFKDKVFSYFIDNIDQDTQTPSLFTILKKDGENPWGKGAAFPTSRPGNLLIDSQGVLHAFVFEALDATINDSRGSLIHYFFPKAFEGNITDYQKEVVVVGDPNNETVNIRVGAAISDNDTMALGFGLTTFNSLYKGHSEHLYYKKPANKTWVHLIAGENLGHDWYYPFVLATKDSFHLLPVQDDFADDGNPETYNNIYQKIIYFTNDGGAWKNQLIADLSTHPLAKSRPRLLEQEELFKDSQGTIHIIYKEFLDNQETWKATAHKHVTIGKDRKKEEVMKTNADINWIRIFDVDGELYYFASTFNEFFIGKHGQDSWTRLDVPADAKGAYPYIAKTRGDFVDILLLAADSKTYSEEIQKNYYIRIPLFR